MKEIIRRMTKEEVVQKKFDVCNSLIMHPESITKALEQADVSHSTYYKWKKEDKNFGASLEHLDNARFDFVENAMFKRIGEGSDAMIKLYLETHGGDRRYDKVKKIESTVKTTNVISMPAINPDQWDSIALLQQKKLGGDNDLVIDVVPDE